MDSEKQIAELTRQIAALTGRVSLLEVFVVAIAKRDGWNEVGAEKLLMPLATEAK